MKTRVLASAFVLAGVLGAGFAMAADKPAKKPAPTKAPAKEAAKTPAKVEPKLSAAEVEKQLDAAFPAFLKDPSKANFLKVHKLVVSHPAYAPYSSDLDEAADLIEQGNLKSADDLLREGRVNLLLSPRAYQLARRLSPGPRDPKSAQLASETAKKCLQGIRSTGDGTEKQPMIVARSSDAYDVAKSMDKRVAGFRRHSKEDKYYEILRCSDNSELWFDVTAPFGTMAKTFKPRPPKNVPDKESPKSGTPPPAKDKSGKNE
jgi:hypothetical protein